MSAKPIVLALVLVGLAGLAWTNPAPAEAARALVFNSTRWVDWGQCPGPAPTPCPGYGDGSQESENVQASLQALGHTVTRIAGPDDPVGSCPPNSQPGTLLATAAQYSSALAAADVFVIPEQESWCSLPAEMTSDVATVWRNWVANGGGLIVHSSVEAMQKVDDLFFVVFGFRTGFADGRGVTATRTAAAASTRFATGPATLPGFESSGHLAIAGLPAHSVSVYDNGTHAAVAVIPFGAGKIIFLGWDWTKSTPPWPDALDGGWQRILGLAVQEAMADTLTVTRAGSGTGTVTSSPPGIDCGSRCSGSFTGSVTLNATAGAGSIFAGWSGGCSGTGACVVTPSGTPSAYPAVTATFDPQGPPPPPPSSAADIGVYRGSTGQWIIHRAADGGTTVVGWGTPSLGDLPVLADYDGDGQPDIAVYRQATGEWFIRRSTDGGLTQIAWGAPSLDDVPVPADYDGDGQADVAVYRRSAGQWFIRRSTDGGLTQVGWGAPSLGDVPAPGDYDGDGQVDIAVYRRSSGQWFIRRSSDAGLTQVGWGSPSSDDTPVPADYDGDGQVDIAVYRRSSGQWFIRRSTDAGLTQMGWGAPALGDVPVPSDYDADGRMDVAVYRGSNGEWLIHRSSDGGLTQIGWGAPGLGDVPIHRSQPLR